MLIKELYDDYSDEEIIAELKKVLAEQESSYVCEADKTTNFSGYEYALKIIRELSPGDAEGFIISISLDYSGDGEDESRFYNVSGYLAEKPEEAWAMEFRPWESWLAMPVADESLAMFGPLTCLAAILYEMTWVSYDPADIKEVFEDLKQRAEDVKNGNVKTYSMEEVMKRVREKIDGFDDE